MKRLLARALTGLAAGTAGTVAMGGMSFLLRRMVEPTEPIGKTHYEMVVEWVADRGIGDPEMESASRVRKGELLHLGFGAFWGLVYSVVFGNRVVRPLRHGIAYGTTLWTGAFGGYMPALGISKSIKEMDSYELLRTLACHATYAITTATFLKSFRSRSN